MKSFYSYVSNGNYSIGCSGQSVCVYDKNGVEIAVFKDLTYAYDCAISPKGDIFAVKSTEGRLAVYSLTDLCLVKKFRFSQVAESQDDNFCFSADGEEFYNIERHGDSCKTALSIYAAKDFSLKKRLFSEEINTVLTCIEIDSAGNVYLTGFNRKEKSGVVSGFFAHTGGKEKIGVADKWFVAKLVDGTLSDIRYISADEHEYCVDYKKLEMSGFAEKSVKLSFFKDKNDELLKAREEQFSLAVLWLKSGE